MSFITSYSRDQIPLSQIPSLQSAEGPASVDWRLVYFERRICTHIPFDYQFLFTSCWTVKFRRHGLCLSHLCLRNHIQPCPDRTISVCFSCAYLNQSLLTQAVGFVDVIVPCILQIQRLVPGWTLMRMPQRKLQTQGAGMSYNLECGLQRHSSTCLMIDSSLCFQQYFQHS